MTLLCVIAAACGGSDSGSSVSASQLAGGRWTDVPTPPARIGANPRTAVDGHDLFVWAGQDARGITDTAMDLDTLSGQWKPIAQPPLGSRLWPISAWTGEEWLLVGGGTARPGTQQLVAHTDGVAYNPRRKRWDPLESTCRHASLSIL